MRHDPARTADLASGDGPPGESAAPLPAPSPGYTHGTTEFPAPPDPPPAWGRRIIGILSPGLAAALLGLPLLGYHLGFDQGVYAGIGDALLRGGVAYRDAWEFRPPGIFWVNFLAFSWFGRSELAVRILDLAAVGASASALFLILRRRFGNSAAGWAAALAYPLLYVPIGHWATAQCESYQSALALWAVALWPRPREETRAAACFASGTLAGLVVLFKTPGILIPLALGLDLLVRLRREGPAPSLRTLAAFIGGVASIPLLMFTYYAARGALPDLAYALFVYAPAYARSGVPFDPDIDWLGTPRLAAIFGLPALGLGLLGPGRLLASDRPEAARLLALFAVAAAGIALQGRYYEQHFLAWCPWLALAAGTSVLPGPRAARAAGFALALAFAAVRGADLGGRWSDWIHGRDAGTIPHEECDRNFFTYRESASLAARIREHTRPGDRVFPWVLDPLAVFLSDRPVSGPYSHIGAMLPTWEGQERIDALVRRLHLEPPDLVLVGSKIPIFTARTPMEHLEQCPALHAFLRERYRPAATHDGVQFWVPAASNRDR